MNIINATDIRTTKVKTYTNIAPAKNKILVKMNQSFVISGMLVWKLSRNV